MAASSGRPRTSSMPRQVRSAFLRTRVARRIFGLFLLSAVVPTITLAVVAFHHVRQQLDDQSRTRLQEMSKTTGMSILERLDFLDREVATLAAPLHGRDSAATARLWPYLPKAGRNLLGLALVTDGGRVLATDEMPAIDSLTAIERHHLGLGKPLLRVRPATEAGIGEFLVGRLVDSTGPWTVLWSRIDPSYLLATDPDSPRLPRGMSLCVFDHRRRSLGCSLPGASGYIDLNGVGVGSSNMGTLEWAADGQTYLAGYWNAFLGFGYGIPGWTVVVSEAKETVLLPMANFQRSFPFIALLALLVAALVSNVQIRKSLEPLRELSEGTKRLARQDFSLPVRVASHDEFEDLAGSFNTMSRRLSQQLHALATMNQIDRAVLTNPDRQSLVATAMVRTHGFLGCSSVVLALRHDDHDSTGWDVMTTNGPDGPTSPDPVRLGQNDLDALDADVLITVPPEAEAPPYLGRRSRPAGEMTAYVVLPMHHGQDLVGALALGYPALPDWDEEERRQARQLADQIAVALANTRLIDQLNDLSRGALTALARTIDANSHWTAGHSERVTALAIRIAAAEGLGEEVLDRIHRGGLLHDIGKIGIPAAILDKEGPLTPEERAIVQRHPETGGIILAPISAYADVLDIVRHHHEHYDGGGYPDGLAGDNIPYLARLLAVADVYDALTSDRPYRHALSHEDAVAYITVESGTQFDPRLVKAFLAAVASDIPEVGGAGSLTGGGGRTIRGRFAE